MAETSTARIAGCAALAVSLLAPAAIAHTGEGDAHAFLGGLLHPLTGLDHALAMIAIGALALSHGGRARWWLPAGFLVMMIIGMLSGAAGSVLPQVEMSVAASVAALGVMLLAGQQLPPSLALCFGCVFGILHGNAHGAETQAVGVLPGSAGFFVATAGLHAVGFALAAAVSRLQAWRVGRPERATTSR